ncbi:MAG: hypothetical protein Q7U92_02555 [Bradyrhizobium sp.]|nr:hypothetical protein [Bradyrhizobium sp.]
MGIARVFCWLAVAAAFVTSAAAQTPSNGVTTVYTRIDDVRAHKYGLCRTTKSWGHDVQPVLAESCPRGPNGWAVTLFSADARSSVWFGRRASNATTVSDALEGGFADPHSVIEWRLSGGRPFAAIHRYFLQDRQVLTVHRLQPDGTSCVAALVPVRHGHDANAEAKEVADAIAPSFRCGRDKLAVIGGLANQ